MATDAHRSGRSEGFRAALPPTLLIRAESTIREARQTIVDLFGPGPLRALRLSPPPRLWNCLPCVFPCRAEGARGGPREAAAVLGHSPMVLQQRVEVITELVAALRDLYGTQLVSTNPIARLHSHAVAVCVCLTLPRHPPPRAE